MQGNDHTKRAAVPQNEPLRTLALLASEQPWGLSAENVVLEGILYVLRDLPGVKSLISLANKPPFLLSIPTPKPV